MPTCAELAINNWKGQQCCKVFHSGQDSRAKSLIITQKKAATNSFVHSEKFALQSMSKRESEREGETERESDSDCRHGHLRRTECEWWQNCHDNKSSIIMCQAMRQCQLATGSIDALTHWASDGMSTWMKPVLPLADALQRNWRELSTLGCQHGKSRTTLADPTSPTPVPIQIEGEREVPLCCCPTPSCCCSPSVWLLLTLFLAITHYS